MIPDTAKPVKCRNCSAEIVRGIWFDPRGEGHPGAWVHVAGGVLCKAGAEASPPGDTTGVRA